MLFPKKKNIYQPFFVYFGYLFFFFFFFSSFFIFRSNFNNEKHLSCISSIYVHVGVNLDFSWPAVLNVSFKKVSNDETIS